MPSFYFVSIYLNYRHKWFFKSSTELKAHLSWKLKSAFLIACRPSSVYLSIRRSVTFSYFQLLLQNHWANFNQTWVKGIQVCSNEEPFPFPRGDNYRLTNFNSLLLKKRCANFNQTWHQSSLGKGDSSLFK